MVKTLSGPVRGSSSGQVKELVIFFHGYGADGNDLISLADHFADILPNAEFFAPNAPDYCEIGGVGYQWFPISQNKNGTLDLDAKDEILNSVNIIDDWINDLMSKMSTCKTLLEAFLCTAKVFSSTMSTIIAS